MAEGLSSAILVGSTGLVGSHVFTTLSSLPLQPAVHAIGRRSLSSTYSNLKPIVETDTSKWPDAVKKLVPAPNVLISALGATRAQAGSFEAQRKVDYDLNLSLAQAAKDSGVRVYVLISSDAVSRNSIFPYGRMKAELEDAVKELNFPYTVILKPGLLVGTRSDSRPAEAVLRGIANTLGSLHNTLKDCWAQDADVVGKAAVAAATKCATGKRGEGIWVVTQKEIVQFGRTEWKIGAKSP